MKITTEESVSIPAHIGPKIMVGIASVLAAPFTGGLSLLVGPGIALLGFSHEKRQATERTSPETNSQMEGISEDLQNQIRAGKKHGSGTATAFDYGNGTVERKLKFRITDD